MNGAPAEIRIDGLCKAFGAHRVLTGIDLSIERGEIVAIVGGSGSGKTVLLNHILGRLDPDQGRVLVADHDMDGAPLIDLTALDTMETDRLHTHWGVVFQRNALFSGTVLDNIGLWLSEVRGLEEPEIVVVAQKVLAAVDLPDTDDFMATDVNELSGGMAKRLAVARALAMDPEVLFYDEPTTGLDPTTASTMHDLIARTHVAPTRSGKHRTTLIVTHDKDLLRRLQPRTVMLHEGGVFFDGPFADFEGSASPIIRPYFDLMPVLHGRALDPRDLPPPGHEG
ncbi:MAG TPA: ABC transporter [Rhodospirillaceae bacterium]|nr:ABC transporter [Magnetovibrio sp.]HBT43625.1 ABC transporter [Rhodospirillaceae bacterium]HCS71991.1 ABC transporter [Rhodospirillaceae bacterium]|tara:strand:- start:2571 stop:3416 length:846 start_codon:yes stop_codon:yes gene_type:complete